MRIIPMYACSGITCRTHRRRKYVLIFLFAVAVLPLGSVPQALAQTQDVFCQLRSMQTLGEEISDSKCICLLEVAKVDRKKGVVHYKNLANLKGASSRKEMEHDFHDAKGFLDWAQPGKTAIQFHHDNFCRVCVGYAWYCFFDRPDELAYLSRDPLLMATYVGPVDKLRQAVVDILAGREVVISAVVWNERNREGSWPHPSGRPGPASPYRGDWLRGDCGRISRPARASPVKARSAKTTSRCSWAGESVDRRRFRV
jgi:hypothetical protein